MNKILVTFGLVCLALSSIVSADSVQYAQAHPTVGVVKMSGDNLKELYNHMEIEEELIGVVMGGDLIHKKDGASVTCLRIEHTDVKERYMCGFQVKKTGESHSVDWMRIYYNK